MKKEKKLEIVNALQGLTRQEWDELKKEIEISFQYHKLEENRMIDVCGLKSHPIE